MTRTLTYRQALRRLPPGPTVGTYLCNQYAEWDRSRIIDELKRAAEIWETGSGSGFGLLISFGGRPLLIGTRREGES